MPIRKESINGWIRKRAKDYYWKGQYCIYVAPTPRIPGEQFGMGKFCVALTYCDSPPDFIGSADTQAEAEKVMRKYMGEH